MVNTQEWLDRYYPENGTCQRKEDEENYGKTSEEIINLDISGQSLEGGLALWSKKRINGRFPNLRTLNASFNSLNAIGWPYDGRVRQDYLEEIDFSHNLFSATNLTSSISINSFPKLRIANVSYNNLVSNFSVFDNEYLTRIDCSNSQLVSLAFRNNSNLQEIDCSNNPIVSLSLNANAFSNLKLFNCLGAKLSSPVITNPSICSSDATKIITAAVVPSGTFLLTAATATFVYYRKHAKKKQRANDTMRLNDFSSSQEFQESEQSQQIKENIELKSRLKIMKEYNINEKEEQWKKLLISIEKQVTSERSKKIIQKLKNNYRLGDELLELLEGKISQEVLGELQQICEEIKQLEKVEQIDISSFHDENLVSSYLNLNDQGSDFVRWLEEEKSKEIENFADLQWVENKCAAGELDLNKLREEFQQWQKDKKNNEQVCDGTEVSNPNELDWDELNLQDPKEESSTQAQVEVPPKQ